jgi:class 3 adenylate cyclase
MEITGTVYRNLQQVLTKCYDISGLKELCGILGIPHESVIVKGETIEQAANRLIIYCNQRATGDSLIIFVIEDRPGHPAVIMLNKALHSTGFSALEKLPEVSDEGRQTLKSVSSSAPEGVVTICFSDIEGYSAFSQRMSEQAAHELVKRHNSIVRDCIRRHNGYEVKTLGDGFMIVFSLPADGVLCALNIQCEFALWNAAHPHEPIWVRIGLNTGKAISAGGDFEGDAVNAAARISAQANGGKVIVSSVVKLLCEHELAINFIDLGPRPLKGFVKEFHLFEIDWHRRNNGIAS